MAAIPMPVPVAAPPKTPAEGPSRKYVKIPANTLMVMNVTSSASYLQIVNIKTEDHGTPIKARFSGKGHDRTPLQTWEGHTAGARYFKLEPMATERTLELNFLNNKLGTDAEDVEVSVAQGPTTQDNNRVTIQTIGTEDGDDLNFTDSVVTVFFFPK